jgi:hypothetical protein
MADPRQPKKPIDEENIDLVDVGGDDKPLWIYDQLSWYLSWAWGNVRSRAQPLVSNRYSADCVYKSAHGNFEIHLGGIPSLFNEEKLKEVGITHILTAVLGIGDTYSKDKFTTLNVPIRDVEWEQICEYFDKAADFIKECEDANGKVFVHCMCGVSRSSTLVCAFLIREKGMTASEAVEFIHSKRQKVDPNKGFRKQLEYYEQKIKSRV